MAEKKPIYEMLEMSDGISIQTARFEPDTDPIGVVHVIHGFGEHIGCYIDAAGFFTRNNYVCIIHDQRGFGKRHDMTDKERFRDSGSILSYDLFLEDIGVIRKLISSWYPNIPVFVYGHSMGGNIAINYLLKRTQEEYAKAIFETPWLRLYKKMPAPAIILAGLLGKMNYRLALINKLILSDITRDKEVVEALKDDIYYHNRISFLLFSNITKAGEFAICNASGIKTPALLLCAGDDKIVCPNAIREFASNACTNVILREYADGYHSLHSDICKDEVFKDIISFLS